MFDKTKEFISRKQQEHEEEKKQIEESNCRKIEIEFRFLKKDFFEECRKNIIAYCKQLVEDRKLPPQAIATKIVAGEIVVDDSWIVEMALTHYNDYLINQIKSRN